MFDKTYITPQSKPTHKTVSVTQTVHEHRAPTDESVKLLNEMQDKAIGNIIDTIVVQNNILNFVAVVFDSDIIHQSYNIKCKFSINWSDMIIDINIPTLEFKLLSYDDRIRLIYKNISDKLSFMILKHLDANTEASRIIYD